MAVRVETGQQGKIFQNLSKLLFKKVQIVSNFVKVVQSCKNKRFFLLLQSLALFGQNWSKTFYNCLNWLNWSKQVCVDQHGNGFNCVKMTS